MVTCPFCGAASPYGTLVCASCGNEVVQQTAEPSGGEDRLHDSGPGDTLDDTITGGGEATEPPLQLDSSVPGSTIPPERGGPPPDGWGREDITRPSGLDHSIPGSEIPPSHGGGIDHSQPPSDEPPPGRTRTMDVDMPRGEVPDRDKSARGPAVDMTGGAGPGMPSPGAGEPSAPPPERRTSRLVFGAFVVVVVIVLVVALSLIFMDGDDDGDGNGGPDGGPNGHNGNGPRTDLHIDPLETSVNAVWEPNPGLRLDVIILNNATSTVSLDGHDLFVTVFIGMDKVGQATETVSGTVEAGGGKWVPVGVDVAIESGQTYKVSVMLRKDGGNTTVDSYFKEVTVE